MRKKTGTDAREGRRLYHEIGGLVVQRGLLIVELWGVTRRHGLGKTKAYAVLRVPEDRFGAAVMSLHIPHSEVVE